MATLYIPIELKFRRKRCLLLRPSHSSPLLFSPFPFMLCTPFAPFPSPSNIFFIFHNFDFPSRFPFPFFAFFALPNSFPFAFLLFRPSLPFNQLSVVPISSHFSPISPPFTFSFFVSAPFSSPQAVGVSPVCCRYCSCSAFHSFQIGQRRR